MKEHRSNRSSADEACTGPLEGAPARCPISRPMHGVGDRSAVGKVIESIAALLHTPTGRRHSLWFVSCAAGRHPAQLARSLMVTEDAECPSSLRHVEEAGELNELVVRVADSAGKEAEAVFSRFAQIVSSSEDVH